MAATEIGVTGNWGIPQDEAGLILYDLSFDFSIQEKPVLNKSGEVQGLALYQGVGDIKGSGLVTKDTPFAAKLGTVLALANAMPAHLPSSGGTSVLLQVNRSLNNEDFEKIEFSGRHYPYLIAA